MPGSWGCRCALPRLSAMAVGLEPRALCIQASTVSPEGPSQFPFGPSLHPGPYRPSRHGTGCKLHSRERAGLSFIVLGHFCAVSCLSKNGVSEGWWSSVGEYVLSVYRTLDLPPAAQLDTLNLSSVRGDWEPAPPCMLFMSHCSQALAAAQTRAEEPLNLPWRRRTPL